MLNSDNWTFTDYDKEIANVICNALYGETFEAMKNRLEWKVKELERAAKETDRTDVKKTEKITKTAALITKVQIIINLYEQTEMSKEDIAFVMDVQLNFVESLILEYRA
ncbi:MAG: hypothetical protein ACPGVB_06780 [Chitinophagales bacterium]